jgi:hypothetical protein
MLHRVITCRSCSQSLQPGLNAMSRWKFWTSNTSTSHVISQRSNLLSLYVWNYCGSIRLRSTDSASIFSLYKHKNRQTNWLTDWLNEWMNEWMNEWVNQSINDWLKGTAKLLLVLARTVILGSESRGTQCHVLLSVGSGILQATVITKVNVMLRSTVSLPVYTALWWQ